MTVGSLRIESGRQVLFGVTRDLDVVGQQVGERTIVEPSAEL